MRRQNSEKYTGNDRYEGFCVDMMNKIAEYLKCSYTIEIVKDNAYGIIVNETGKWNGMIEVLINKASYFFYDLIELGHINAVCHLRG